MVLTQRNWKTSNWYVILISEEFDHLDVIAEISIIEICFHCFFKINFYWGIVDLQCSLVSAVQ